ncbi:MAG: TIGR04283 family arsenosugar biosynthesis glycosyltransferase [Ruegeria sp.]
MPAPISIVIPTLNAGDSLPRTLGALMEGLQVGLIRELVVSDGGSIDLTLKIAEEAGAEVLSGPPSRGGQLRRGCAAAKGEWLMVLHADTVLDSGWSRVVADHLPSAQPTAFRLVFDASGFWPRWVAGWANFRSRFLRLPYGDQGLLVRRVDYDAVGGYPDQPLMEDVAIVRALPRVILLKSCAFTNADRYVRSGWVRRGARNLWTLIRYFLGADPEKLAQAYRR